MIKLNHGFPFCVIVIKLQPNVFLKKFIETEQTQQLIKC